MNCEDGVGKPGMQRAPKNTINKRTWKTSSRWFSSLEPQLLQWSFGYQTGTGQKTHKKEAWKINLLLMMIRNTPYSSSLFQLQLRSFKTSSIKAVQFIHSCRYLKFRIQSLKFSSYSFDVPLKSDSIFNMKYLPEKLFLTFSLSVSTQ